MTDILMSLQVALFTIKTKCCLMADRTIVKYTYKMKYITSYLSGSQNLSELHNPSIFIGSHHFPPLSIICVLNELQFLIISL